MDVVCRVKDEKLSYKYLVNEFIEEGVKVLRTTSSSAVYLISVRKLDCMQLCPGGDSLAHAPSDLKQKKQ